MCLLSVVFAPFALASDVANGNVPGGIGLGVLLSTAIVSGLLLWRGHRTAAAWVLVAVYTLVINGLSWWSGGVTTGLFAGNGAMVVLSGLMLRLPGIALVWGAAMLFGGLSAYWPHTVDLPHAVHIVHWWMVLGFIAIVVAAGSWVGEEAIGAAELRSGQLQESIAELEASNISRDVMESLLAALPELVLVTDPGGRVVSASGRGTEWTGDTMVGRLAAELFTDSGRTTQARLVDDPDRALLLSVGELPGGGEVWASADVTALTDATEALRSAHEAARVASRAKSHFLSSMSHELRTPLNAIIGYAELLEDDVDDPVAVEDLGRIGRASHSLLDLINGVLDLSKVESGKLSVSQQEVELDDIIGPLEAVMEPIVLRRDLYFRVLGHVEGPAISTDPAKLRQVLLNLLSNAAKFTDDGGITLTVERWERSRLPWIRFVVADTGIGMNDASLARVFEPFAQADRSHDAVQRKGTGLGLSICKAFIDILGGQIYGESEVGVGSRFVVEVPAAYRAVPSMPTPSVPIPDAVEASARVLVVDDDEDFLSFAARTLAAPGRQVVCTPDPLRALEWAKRFKVDLIVLDVEMPEMSGWSFMVRLRDSRSAGTPVVVVSVDPVREVAEALGSADFMLKPVSAATLKSRVDRTIGAQP